MEQIATGSHDVERYEVDLTEPVDLGETVAAATMPVPNDDSGALGDAVSPVPVLNAATQTPLGIPHQPIDTPMIPVSDGEYSEYEAHFSQVPVKDDKARKLASRTPEIAGKPADKLEGGTGKVPTPARKLKSIIVGGEGGTGVTSQAAGKVEKRHGKDAGAGLPAGIECQASFGTNWKTEGGPAFS
ncbi:unnamed protein product [Calypogeia fissa]